MFLGLITLFTALAMATVAAVFAIFGIVAIFAGMPAFAIVMGSVIELGKVVGISWLYRNWSEPTKIKYVMTPLVILAMLLTSMGIFGLLSKAHLEQTAPVANNAIQIERLDQQINRERAKITDSEQVIAQLDQSVQVLINYDRIRGPEGALAVREGQSEQRDLLRETIDTAQAEIDRLEDKKLELNQALKAIELEVGPVKYLAELVYGSDTSRTEEAVRWVIIAFIIVFDPMAVLLLMAGNYTLAKRSANKKSEQKPEQPLPVTEEPVIEVDEPKQTSEIQQEPEQIQNQTSVIEEEPAQEPEVETTEVGEPTEVQIEEPEIQPAIENTEVTEVDEIEQTTAQPKEIKTEGVTFAEVDGGYVRYNDRLIKKEALKDWHGELFGLEADTVSPVNTSFGTKFPKIAKVGDIFVRVDMLPNKVFKFQGNRWIELDKSMSNSYLYDEEYIRYLISKIESGEYDIDLISDSEREQIEHYILNNKSQ